MTGPIDQLAPALLALQKTATNITRDAKAVISANRAYKYARLESVLADLRPLATEAGIVILQPITREGTQVVVTTILLHAASGQVIEVPFSMDGTGCSAQELGSLVTYARRYSLLALLALGQEDDDGAAATAAHAARKIAPLPRADEPPKPEAMAWLREHTAGIPADELAALVRQHTSGRTDDLSEVLAAEARPLAKDLLSREKAEEALNHAEEIGL